MKKYIEPRIELSRFQFTDIITVSGAAPVDPDNVSADIAGVVQSDSVSLKQESYNILGFN